MLKKSLVLFLAAVLSAVSVAQHRFQKHPGEHPLKHPLISVLKSGEFTPEEQSRLKQLAEKDPKAFNQEMRNRLQLIRKKEAQKILELRKHVLEAESREEKDSALNDLRQELRKRAEQRLSFHKRILDETEKNIKAMQHRYDKLRKEYDSRSQNIEQNMEKELDQLLKSEPPKRLIRNANWEPEKE